MAECIHRPLCTNECPCDYLVEQKETEYTALVPDFKGSQDINKEGERWEIAV